MLTLADLEELVLIESGQFVAAKNVIQLGLSRERFWSSIVKNRLSLYQRYRPITRKFNRESSFAKSYGAHVFFGYYSGKAFDKRKTDDNPTPYDGDIPSWISSVVPTETGNKRGDYINLMNYEHYNEGEYRSLVVVPRPFQWKYETGVREYTENNIDKKDKYGILYLIEEGVLDITAHYDYEITENEDSSGLLIPDETYIDGADEGKDKILIDLIIGRFLITVGRARRMFRLEQFPVEADATELVAEGQEIQERAMEALYDQAVFYHAFSN